MGLAVPLTKPWLVTRVSVRSTTDVRPATYDSIWSVLMSRAPAHARALAGLALRNDTSCPGSHTPSWRVPPYSPGVAPLTLPVAPFSVGGTVGDVNVGVV